MEFFRRPSKQLHRSPTTSPEQQLEQNRSAAKGPETLASTVQSSPVSFTPTSLLGLQRSGGNRMVSRILAQSKAPVQRLISAASFRSETKLGKMARRNKIAALDTSLANYHLIALTSFGPKVAQLDDIIAKCDIYLARPDTKAKRKPGTQKLRAETVAEKTIVERLRDNPASGNNVARLKDLRAIENLYNAATLAGHTISNGIIEYIRQQMLGVPLTPGEATTLQGEDLDQLRALAADPLVPAITRDLINEILGNEDNIRMENTTAGSSAAAVPAGGGGDAGGTDYRIRYGQYHGDADRLGTLVHEMTHVSVGESFGNTKAFLSYAATATEDEIIALSAHRTVLINQLKQLWGQDVVFGPPQKEKLKEQLDYAISTDKIGKYMEVMTRTGDPAASTKFGNAWVNSGNQVNLSVIEYDTVINQMLIYMQIWGIPTVNPFYAKLRDCAQEAFDQRLAARV